MPFYFDRLVLLIRRGREIRRAFAADPSAGATLAEIRVWQHDCEDIVRQLSGGSKAHWVSRAYSQAFLIRSTTDALVEEADVGEILDRLIDVLEQATAALSQEDSSGSPHAEAAPPNRRFDFVHNAALRPILGQAYANSRDALDAGHFAQALVLSCSVLEAILTDALEHLEAGGVEMEAGGGEPAAGGWRLEAGAGKIENGGPIAERSFDARIAAAERSGLIRRGCARLPAIARRYRDLTDAAGDLRPDATVSERDARLVTQVLHVVMRDLDPGR